MKWILMILIGASLVMSSAPVARAADKDDSKSESKNDSKETQLRKRFEQRDKQIRQLKKAGVIGETADGYVDWVKDEVSKDRDVVDAENNDRKALYELIAKKTNTTAEKVAERAGKRNFERATAGEYLKDKDGNWKKKEG